MTKESPRKPDPLLLACAWIPAAGLAVFYSYVVRARLSLGSWPQPYRPDPKDLGFDVHHDIVGWFLEAAIVSPVALVVALLLHQFPGLRDGRVLGSVVTFSVGYLLIWGLLLVDPGSFFEWYAD